MWETTVSLLISFGLAWHGRDRIWTPTFEGTRQERFVQAMHHYHGKMGLSDSLAFELHDSRSAKHPERCSSVEFTGVGFVLVTWWGKGKGCTRIKPEFWALHEACHLRMLHHIGAGGPRADKQEAEARQCAEWYSEKARR